MKIYIKKRYKTEITTDIIDSVLAKLSLAGEYDTVYEKGDGRRIIIEDGGKRIYVILSRADAKDSRNAFLTQYVPTVMTEFIKDRCANKRIGVYILDTSYRAKTAYIIDAYRILKTLGIETINGTELGLSAILPYTSFTEWKLAKTNRQNRNTYNQASYAAEEDGEYYVYGKVFGANVKDAVLFACMLAMFAARERKKLNFIQVKEHDTERVTKGDRELLEYYGVRLDDNGVIVKDKQGVVKTTCRDQDLFRYNLFEKYGDKKCYLCDCDIESAIIASHIHRITDLDNADMPFEEKHKCAVDGDNGFWLCATHDKLFEYGQITFDMNGELVIDPALSAERRAYIESITKVTSVSPEHLTDGLKEYLDIHNKRVGLG